MILGDMFHHIVVYWGRYLQFPQWIHAFNFVYKNYATLPSDVENWRRYVSHNSRRGYVRFQPIRPHYIHGDRRALSNYCRVTVIGCHTHGN